jgi:CopA family copper-resistance protein
VRRSAHISRRRFVKGLIAGGAIVGFDPWRWSGLAQTLRAAPAVLSGSRFELTIDKNPIDITGRPALATTVNGTVPGPTLRWREGDTVTIAVTNRLSAPTSIHWHGIRSPADMDGVPGLSFRGIAPGETFTYRIPVRQSGTYWYHSHSRFQEQTGHYGALIVEPRGSDPIQSDRDYLVLLSDWTDEDPETILSNLKQQSGYYNYNQPTVGTFLADARINGLRPTLSDRLRWGAMNMSPADILDVSGATYTYLINGQPPAANWTALFRPGERVRLRIVNASSMTIFDVRVPNLQMTLVQADGNDVEPVTIDELRIANAETYDVIVEPRENSAYAIFAQAEDRTGYACATLAPRSGMTAAIPPMDPRPVRTMIDMGMPGMTNMPGKSEDSGKPGNPGASRMSSTNTRAQAAVPSATPSAASEPEGDMQAMNMGDEKPAASARPSGPAPAHEMAAMPMPGPGVEANKPLQPSSPIHLERGPEIDNVAEMTSERLSDPGDGLRGNGRRVLTYADLRARVRGADPRPPTREIELHLTGNMQRYVWGFNGKKFSEAEPVALKLGERVRFVLVNDTMMEHPVHLHGLWSELENGRGEFRPYKHTILVKPAERLCFLVSADTPGRWAFHCHLLYHMENGMFRAVVVS